MYTHPVIEIFGPTIQGEGALAGQKSHFIRFGGCDYRCTWCDSLYAVNPHTVKETAQRLTAVQIEQKVVELGGGDTPWVTLTGGNPCIHQLGDLVDLLLKGGHDINVETQGSLAPEWLERCQLVTVSPKPPSSGMQVDLDDLNRCLATASRAILKIPVFGVVDLQWAKLLHQDKRFKDYPLYLTVGTESGGSLLSISDQILHRYDWLVSQVLGDPTFGNVNILPQLHVLLWGHKRGV
jgi:7-carboxy-7-deazaguanine synthase